MTQVLSEVQLKRLEGHKYSSTGTSLLEPYAQKFWRWLIDQVPMWWAPNAITLTGLIVNVVTTIILLYYSPDARREVPGWALVLCGLGLFIYQSLDAIDGKQARRTGSSSPLGELFDHGCDAMSIAFVSLGVCISMQLGLKPGWMMFECLAAMVLFYTAHWQTYVSGTLRFGKLDVTEAQYCVIGLYFISGIFGTSFWLNKVAIIGIELCVLVLYFSVVIAILACHSYFSVILGGGIGKNGSTIAGTSVLSPILPMAIVVVLALMIWQKSVTHIYENHPCLYILSFSMVGIKVINKLIIAHMTKSEMGFMDSSYIGPGLLFLNQYFNTILNEYIVLWMCFMYCVIDLLAFSVAVCKQICDYLDIYCFKIVPKESTSSSPAHRTNGQSSSNSRSGNRPTTRASSRLAHRK